MSVKYTLVNPQILGSIDTTVKAGNSLKAAKQFYKALSEHFNNTIPSFHFTIQKGGSGKGKYYHFKVSEEKDEDTVDFTLEPIQIANEEEAIARFQSRSSAFKKKCEQAGGAKKGKRRPHADSDDDLFDTEEDERVKTLWSIFPTVYDYPIGYFWYDPYVYNLDFYYIPTFYSYITPFIEIVGF